ncbi:MAG TPA: hypothetical protein VFI79_19410 [Gemmatimonadales bacterium]|nr:hypothetical protein [Gemmatimonadales bacterium]
MSHPTPQQIIKPYLDEVIERFGDVAEFVEFSPHSSDSAAEAIMNNSRLAPEFMERVIPSLFEASRQFWVKNETTMLRAVRQLPGMKATFGGDMGPQRYFRQLERGGLYFDTVLVQDPILRAMRVPEISPVMRTQVAIKYALEMVWHAPLYMSPISPPIAVLIPDRELGTERPAFDARWAETEPWATLFWSEVLDREFENYHEVRETVESMKSAEAVLDAIKRPDLFRMYENAAPDPHSQWKGLNRAGFSGELVT